jgi:hypothetical protein
MAGVTLGSLLSRILPITALVLDSGPGISSLRLDYTAASIALPRSFIHRVVGAAILWALVLAHEAINVIRNCEDVFSVTRTKLNHTTGAFICKIRQDACTSIHRLIKWSRGNMSRLMRRNLSGFWKGWRLHAELQC